MGVIMKNGVMYGQRNEADGILVTDTLGVLGTVDADVVLQDLIDALAGSVESVEINNSKIIITMLDGTSTELIAIDSTPTTGSSALVTSGGVYSGLASKLEKETVCHIETASTSSRNYEIEDYLIYNDTLYLVVDSIFIGDELVPDENIEATSVSAELQRKVNASPNKGLSTNDYTNDDKEKLTDLPDADTLNNALANKQSLLRVTQSIGDDHYLYNNYYAVS